MTQICVAVNKIKHSEVYDPTLAPYTQPIPIQVHVLFHIPIFSLHQKDNIIRNYFQTTDTERVKILTIQMIQKAIM